jgi:hypothetical protein
MDFQLAVKPFNFVSKVFRFPAPRMFSCLLMLCLSLSVHVQLISRYCQSHEIGMTAKFKGFTI